MASDVTTVPASDLLAAPPAPRRTVWTGVLLLALAVLAGATMRTVFSPLQEAAKLELGLTDFHISLIQGVAFAVPIALFAIPLGWLADRSNRVRILIALSITWTAGTLLTAFAEGFGMLFFARMLAGVAGNCVVPVAISVAADYCLPERRGRTILVLSLGNVVGAAIAFMAGGLLLGAVLEGAAPSLLGLAPWREVSLMVGVASALLTLPLFLLREPARHEVEKAGASVGDVARALWSRRRFLFPLFVGQVGVVMADTAATIWAAPVLIRDFDQTPAEFAGWMGGALIVAGVIGSLIGGFAADWGQKLRMKGGLLTGAVAGAVLTVPTALYPIMPNAGLFGVMLTLLLIGGTVAGLVTATAIAVLIPNEERGLCLGAFMIMGALVGMGAAPIIVTLASQAMGGEAQLAPALAITSVIISALSLLGFWIALRNAPARPADEGLATEGL